MIKWEINSHVWGRLKKENSNPLHTMDEVIPFIFSKPYPKYRKIYPMNEWITNQPLADVSQNKKKK